MTFSDWFTKALDESDVQAIKAYPTVLMDSHDKSVLRWCIDYSDRFGSLPPTEIVKNEAPNGELYVKQFVPKENIDKLFAESKRQQYDIRVKELKAEYSAKDKPNHALMAQQILMLDGHLKDVRVKSMEDMDDIYVKPKNIFNFKYRSLNNAVHSILGTELAIFAGPQKSKKTWILLDLYVDAVKNQKKKAYIFSNELSETGLQQRMHAMIGGFNPSVYRSGTQEELNISKQIYIEKKKEFDAISEGKMIFPSSYYTTYHQVVQDIRNTKPDIAFIDSVHAFMDEKGRPIEDNWGEITAMVRSFKECAMSMGIPIICNTQLKGTPDGAPTADDIALSKSFARTADLVVGLNPDDGNNVEKVSVNIIASRNSSNVLSTKIKFDFDTCVFEEYTPRMLQSLQNG